MKKILFVIAIAAVIAGPALAQTAADHIQEGDAAYAAFDDTKALENYQAALALEPGNYEALWKTSRAMVDIADVIPGTGKDVKERQKEMYTEATSLARKAVAANPDDTWGHFQLAAANGKRLLLLGKKEQIAASKAVRDSIEKAIELDPTNHLAYHAYGRWHRRMDEIGGAKRLFGSILYGSIPKGSFRRVGDLPAEGHRAAPRVHQPLPRARPDARRPQEIRRGGRVLPERHRHAQDDLEG